MAKPEHVTKLEGAERQLKLAIRLFFNHEDMIGIHTLTAAASQVIRDLARKRGSASPIRDEQIVTEIIRPEKKQEWVRILKRAENFFKHANHDSEEMLDFFPDATPWLIFEAILMHNQLTGGYIPETLVFATWFNLKHPDVLLGGPLKTVIQEALAQGLDPDDFEKLRTVLKLETARQESGKEYNP